ncbi:MAG: YgjV family protein [Candidatus Pacebacteria bacterium]|nr:YgjV family protein [Candidatus Paceibacterota bacterium]
MMSLFIWSQILAGIGMGISITAAQIKNPVVMRVMFFISALFRGTHFIFLGVPQAGIITFVTGSRWLSSVFTHKKWVMVFFIIITFVAGWFNHAGIISALPVIAGVLGTLAAFSDNDRRMRIYLIIAMILWVIHNIVVFTPVGILSSVFFLVSMMIGYERFYHYNHIQFFHDQPVHNQNTEKK